VSLSALETVSADLKFLEYSPSTAQELSMLSKFKALKSLWLQFFTKNRFSEKLGEYLTNLRELQGLEALGVSFFPRPTTLTYLPEIYSMVNLRTLSLSVEEFSNDIIVGVAKLVRLETFSLNFASHSVSLELWAESWKALTDLKSLTLTATNHAERSIPFNFDKFCAILNNLKSLDSVSLRFVLRESERILKRFRQRCPFISNVDLQLLKSLI
jgi:hypothetical protein